MQAGPCSGHARCQHGTRVRATVVVSREKEKEKEEQKEEQKQKQKQKQGSGNTGKRSLLSSDEKKKSKSQPSEQEPMPLHRNKRPRPAQGEGECLAVDYSCNRDTQWRCLHVAYPANHRPVFQLIACKFVDCHLCFSILHPYYHNQTVTVLKLSDQPACTTVLLPFTALVHQSRLVSFDTLAIFATHETWSCICCLSRQNIQL